MNSTNDPFDDLLRTAMRRRPEVPAPEDLAARAMEITQLRPAPTRLRRFRLMARLASLAAMILIATIVAIGIHRLADHGNLTLTPGESWTDSSTASADTSLTTTSSTNTYSTYGWIIMVGVIGLTGLGAAGAIRQSSPFSATAGMIAA